MNRRFFLHKGALAVAGTAAIPSFMVRSVLAEAAPAPGQRLVVIFQRGAADGLNVVVPISMDSSVCIHHLRRSSRYTIRAISPSFTPAARPICRARTLMRRTTWSRERRA
jgi:uncharacterized protein (DUF1501 family)